MKLKINDKALAERIKKICELVGGPTKLSRLSKLSQTAIYGLLSGSVDPSRSSLISISNAAGVSLNWLMTGEGPMYAKDLEYRPAQENYYIKEKSIEYDSEEYVKIPVVAGSISAGTGVIPDNFIESYCMFKREWIIRKGDPKQMSLIKVRGDSMHPTLQSGDIVLVNHGIKDIYDGYI